MKEDVLEQIVDDYLQFQGYFTKHNIRFRPRNAADYATGKRFSTAREMKDALSAIRTGGG